MRLFIDILILALAVNGCATTSVTSPYLNPDDGKIFKYGNFCGPSFPRFEGETDLVKREEKLLSSTPVDDIDRACRAHDLCYEFFGHDNTSCDRMLENLLRAEHQPNAQPQYHDRNATVVHNGTSCRTLADEIVAGVAILKGNGIDNPIATAILKSPWIAMEIATRAIQLPGSFMAGWPDEGQCSIRNPNFRRLHRSIEENAVTAFTDDFCTMSKAGIAFENRQSYVTCRKQIADVTQQVFTIEDFYWTDSNSDNNKRLSQESLADYRNCLSSRISKAGERRLGSKALKRQLHSCVELIER